MPSSQDSDIETVYARICDLHDGIADFRAKLLALLPIASGLGIFLLVGDEPPDPSFLPHLLPVGVFGVLVTLGLFAYELRGIQKCEGLIACAKRLEKEFLAHELRGFGAFRFRQTGALGGAVGATGAALVIYSAVVGAWVYVAAVGVGAFARDATTTGPLTFSAVGAWAAFAGAALTFVAGKLITDRNRSQVKAEVARLEEKVGGVPGGERSA